MLKIKKWHIRSELVLIIASSILICINPIIFQTIYYRSLPFSADSFIFMISFFIVIAIILINFVNLILIPFLFQILFPITLVFNSLAFYFMSHFGIVIDKGNLINFLETDPKEVAELISIRLVATFFVFTILPIFLLAKTRVQYRGLLSELKNKIIILALSILVLAAIIAPQYKSFSFFLRSHPEIKKQLIPINYIGSLKAILYEVKRVQAVRRQAQAHITGEFASLEKKMVYILVVGETARADHFSLNGYERETNPLLKAEGLINFPNVFSCGTSTAESLPCMFTPKGSHASSQEFSADPTLVDYFKTAGFSVEWIDNNSGCKGICDRVIYTDTRHIPNNPHCNESGCFDESLLFGLKEKILQNQSNKMLFVLHMLGSHGPTYYARYPKEFSYFRDECTSSELMNCDLNQIKNSYDNTIRYSDFVISKLINEMKSLTQITSVVLYISDHGESLGEMGLYLHGFPYKLAPDAQKHVPMFYWFSSTSYHDLKINRSCIEAKKNDKFHHDNLFHSSLGLFNIKSEDYNPKLDLFSSCRK